MEKIFHCRSMFARLARLVLGLQVALLVAATGAAQEQLLPVIVGGKAGYINESGAIVIPPEFYESHPFSGGFALVRSGIDPHFTDTRLGYINMRGEFRPVPRAEMLGEYREGLARARFMDLKFSSGSSNCYIDLSGNVMIRTGYDDAGDFSEGLAWVE